MAVVAASVRWRLNPRSANLLCKYDIAASAAMNRVKNSAMAATRNVWREPPPCRRLARWSATSVSSTRNMSVASYRPASLRSMAERSAATGKGTGAE